MFKKFAVSLLSLLFFTGTAVGQNCDKVVYGIPDVNCDGEIQIAVLGDSLVYGLGDTKNKNRGGYILRARKSLPKILIQNVGVTGQTTVQLLSKLEDAFKDGTDAKLKAVLENADVVFLDLGRNDRWLFGLPSDAFKNLLTAGKTIRTEVKKLTGYEPVVVTSVIMLPNRGSQGPWVKELDAIILKSNTTLRPADLRFDLVSKRLLSSDQIHPTSAGYDALASTFVKYIKGKLPAKVKALKAKNKALYQPTIQETVP